MIHKAGAAIKAAPVIAKREGSSGLGRNLFLGKPVGFFIFSIL